MGILSNQSNKPDGWQPYCHRDMAGIADTFGNGMACTQFIERQYFIKYATKGGLLHGKRPPLAS